MLALVLFAPSCGQRRAVYALFMTNRTHQDLDGASVDFGGQPAAQFGSLPRGGLGSYDHVILPIPAEAEVRWSDRGVRHDLKVQLRGAVPVFPDGMNIYFIVEEDGSVTVKVAGKHDRDANAEARKGLAALRRK